MTAQDLRAARDQLGLTQTELARALGLTRGSIARYEASQPIPIYIALAIEALLRRKPKRASSLS